MMKLCSEDCIPCCDFCKHAKHHIGEINGKMVKSAVDGCVKHPDKEHQDIAVGCGFCDDFHCEHAEEDK